MIYSYEEVFGASLAYFGGDELAAKVFVDKYALRDAEDRLLELTPDDMHDRIAGELSRVESSKFEKPLTFEEIRALLDKFGKIIPQGSPMYGIGNPYQYSTLSNCYVLESPLDAYSSIMRTDEQVVQVSKRRGGVGFDLSNIRPSGRAVHNAARSATGLVSFMSRYSNSIREVGQCLAGGQRVLTRQGLVPIEEVVAGDEVWSADGWVGVLGLAANGVKEVYRVTTRRGLSVEATLDHLFLTDEGGHVVERRLGDFEAGDGIVTIPGAATERAPLELVDEKYSPRNSGRYIEDFKTPSHLDEGFAYLVGYTYGNGSVSYDRFGEPDEIDIACPTGNPDVVKKVGGSIESAFGIRVNPVPGDGAVVRFRVSRKGITFFLARNRLLKKKAGSLGIPPAVVRSPSNVQAAFLSGYFDADGDAVGAKCGYRFRSVDREFLGHVQTLLMANGVVSHASTEARKNGWSDLHSITVVGKGSQKRFVAFLKDSLKVAASSHVSRRDNVLTPYRAKGLGVSHNQLSYVPDESQYVSLGCFDRLADEVGGFGEPLVRDEVLSVERVGEVGTYDLVLEKTHLFWCEGFYAHNSGRRGAMMLTCSVHHPEILAFAHAKDDETKVTGSNISVRLTNEFLNAVKEGRPYEQRWPVDSAEPSYSETVDARSVWNEIIRCAHNRAEPGLLFWDRITEESPADCYASFGFTTTSTNPCSELPLCFFDSCRLSLLNLFSYVVEPFTEGARFDYAAFEKDCGIAQRLMDDIVDLEIEKIDAILAKVDRDPEPEHVKAHEREIWVKIREKCVQGRRTGTGITALGDALAAVGVVYGSDESIEVTESIYKSLKTGCYRSSVEMAREIGPFPVWSHELEAGCPFLLRIAEEDPALYEDMKRYGRRNIALLTTAPAGSVSIEAKTSSGIEPVFMLSYVRRKKINPSDGVSRVDFTDPNGDRWQEFTVFHPKAQVWMEVTGKDDLTESPYHGATADAIDWRQRVRLQAAANLHTDHSLSSTVNVPEDVTVGQIAEIYETAWESGCKGITVYRNNCRTGVLVEKKKEITKTTAPKRPRQVPCDIHHTTCSGQKFFVLVGTVDGDPYEVIAGEAALPRSATTGHITKVKKGVYQLADADGTVLLENSTDHCGDDQEALLRMVSTSLRHGADIQHVVVQLSKVRGSMYSFARCLARVLKQYIPDGTVVRGVTCSSCGSSNVVMQEGCWGCRDCGYSKCG